MPPCSCMVATTVAEVKVDSVAFVRGLIATAFPHLTDMSQNQSSHTSAREPSGRYTAAFVGSVVAFFVGLLPFVGPMIGGATAGYLRGPDKQESAIAGALATVLASVVYIGIMALVGLAQVVEGAPGNLVVLIVSGSLPLVYFYACGAVGGFAGAAFSNRESP